MIWRGWMLGLLVSLIGIPLVLAQTSLDERVTRMGKKMLCLCGCNQILVECNHLNCSFSEAAKAKLRQAATRYDSDDMAVQAMIQEYGTKILAAPPTQGFNVTAWVTPFAALLFGLMVIALVLRRWWQKRLVVEPASPAVLDPAWRERIRREIEEEIES
jgi:cytochrome c-type biogenesis protein CcmH